VAVGRGTDAALSVVARGAAAVTGSDSFTGVFFTSRSSMSTRSLAGQPASVNFLGPEVSSRTGSGIGAAGGGG
jgi:hypothetical protein